MSFKSGAWLGTPENLKGQRNRGFRGATSQHFLEGVRWGAASLVAWQ